MESSEMLLLTAPLNLFTPKDAPTSSMITTVLTNTTVLCSSTVMLKCGVDANPAAHTYNFYFNGKLIGNSCSVVFNITVKED